VHVSAKDLGTGKEQKITITASSGLSKDEVERMVRDAGSHATEDKARREVVDTKNRADQLVYQIEKVLQENSGKLSDTDQAPVREAIGDVRSAMEKGDVAAIRSASERLEKASYRLSEIIYRTSAPTGGFPGEGARPGGAGKTDDVIDAEVVDAEEGRRN